MTKFFPSWLLPAVLLLSVGAGLFFFVDRIGCLFQTPYKSAISGADNSFYFYWLRSPVIDGDVSFQNDVLNCATMLPRHQQEVLRYPLTNLGLLPNKYPVGWAVSNLPAYLLVHGGLGFFNYFSGSTFSRDGFSMPYQMAIHLTQLVYGILSLWGAWFILRKWFDRQTAGLAVLLTWLGSFLFAYQTSYLSMPHNFIFAAMIGCFLCTQKLEENPSSWRWWWGVGFLGGLMIITRYQTGVYLLYPACITTAALIRKPSLASRYGMAVLAGLAVIGVQLVAWKMLYGEWFLYSYKGEKFDWFHPRLVEVLFSPFHGLFYWHPLLFLALLGFFAFCFKQSGWQRIWLLSLLLTWWVNGAWQCWWFGAAFGSRAFEGSILFFMAGMAFLLQQAKSRTWIAYSLIAVMLSAATFNLLLAYVSRKNIVPMEEPVTYDQMLEKIHSFLLK